MADEKAALVVDQQLIELGCDRPLDAQPLGRARNNVVECLGPVFAADGNAARLDLPGAADVRIDHGFRSAPERRTRCRLDQLLGLRRHQRQRDRSNTIDLDPRRQKFHPTRYEIVARAINLSENFCKTLCNGHRAP